MIKQVSNLFLVLCSHFRIRSLNKILLENVLEDSYYREASAVDQFSQLPKNWQNITN